MLLVVVDPYVITGAFAQPLAPRGGWVDATNTPTPPAPPGSPPPDEPQRPVEPGTVAQGWDNGSVVSQIGESRELRLIESDNRSLHETPYGNFFLTNDSPYFVGVSSVEDTNGTNKLADSGFFVVYQNAILDPTKETIDGASPDLLMFHYSLLAGNVTARHQHKSFK